MDISSILLIVIGILILIAAAWYIYRIKKGDKSKEAIDALKKRLENCCH